MYELIIIQKEQEVISSINTYLYKNIEDVQKYFNDSKININIMNSEEIKNKCKVTFEYQKNIYSYLFFIHKLNIPIELLPDAVSSSINDLSTQMKELETRLKLLMAYN